MQQLNQPQTVRLSECLKELYPNMAIEINNKMIDAICKMDDKPCLDPSKLRDEWKINPIGKRIISLTKCFTAFNESCKNCERNGN